MPSLGHFTEGNDVITLPFLSVAFIRIKLNFQSDGLCDILDR